MRIGIVENDIEFSRFLEERLRTSPEVESVDSWVSAEIMWRDPALETIDIALLDIHLPGMSGVELAALLGEKYPEIQKVMLTSLHSDDVVFEALKAGAIGYVLKSELENILSVLQIVRSGGAVITPTVALRVMRHFQREESSIQKLAELTPRERQILEELSSGSSPREISDLLALSIHTVRQHIKHIYAKLSVSNRGELTRRLKELGLL